MELRSPENALIFDGANVTKYKNDIWNRSYGSGLYFSALEDLGDKIYIPIGIKRVGSEGTQWFKTPHALHDGYSALKVLKDEQSFALDLPKFKVPRPKSYLKAFKSAILSRPTQYHHFISQCEDTRGVDFYFRTIELEKFSTHLSFTAIATNILAKIFMKELTTNTVSRWMVPVRMKETDGLQASYIGLEVDYKDSLIDTHKALVQKLKDGEQWGFYYLAKVGLLIGRRIITYLTSKSVLSTKTKWMGSVSNLGDLGSSCDLEELYVLHPVRWHRPIGVVLYEINGKQVITICLHKSLKKVDFDGIIKEFKFSIKALSAH